MSDNFQSKHSYTENLKSGNTSDEEVEEEVRSLRLTSHFKQRQVLKALSEISRIQMIDNDRGGTPI